MKLLNIKKKYLITFIVLDSLFLFSFTFLFYGPWPGFRNFWITSAMTTMNHRYLATWFYSDETIEKVLSNNTVVESDDVTDPNMVQFKKYTTSIYRNKYEKELLDHDKDDLYKLIEVSGTGYQGYAVAIYDPSRIGIATTKYLNKRGEDILTVSKRENAVFIGFDSNDKLILGKMSAKEALDIGMRDAVEFGPFLIVNGKRSFVKGNGGWGISPRTAIGQRSDGIVIFLVINGRIASSIGADMVDLCDLMEDFGAINAANLDGGSSTELVINNEIINTPVAGGKNGLRDMPTFWVVK